MKITLLTLTLISFSGNALAFDFYERYLKESDECVEKSRATESISMFHYCVAGAVEHAMLGIDQSEKLLYKPLIKRFNNRAIAWEKYEDDLITEEELNIRINEIDNE